MTHLTKAIGSSLNEMVVREDNNDQLVNLIKDIYAFQYGLIRESIISRNDSIFISMLAST